MRKLFGLLERWEFPIIAMLVVVFMRLPSLSEPGWYGDEGIYLVLGKALREGLVWYRDIHDNKPPMLYLLAAAAGSVFYFRLLLMVWMLVSVAVFDRLSRVMIKNIWAQRLSLLAFAFLTSWPAIEGNIANAEIFMILPVMLGVLLLTKERASTWQLFLAGALWAIAFLFKVPSFFEVWGLGFFLFIGRKKKVKEMFKAVTDKRLWLVVSGFVFIVAVSSLYYLIMGAGREYLIAAFLQNFGYLSSWRTGSITKSGASTQSGLFARGLILLVVYSIFLWRSRKLDWRYRLTFSWFVFGLFGALLSERPYPHYLIQVVAPGSLLLCLTAKKIARWGWAGVAIGLLVIGVLRFKFYFYPTLRYYGNFISYVGGKMDERSYKNSFDYRAARTEEAAEYIKKITNEGERIFVWGDEPFIYVLSERLPVGKYTVAYHVIDFAAKESTLERLKQEKPRVVVLSESETRDFSELTGWVMAEYLPLKQFEDLTVYLRSSTLAGIL
ncbi:hypothetical protein HY333_01245 [Candidatus Collierbacteria bacterium]|nr:hypothetical protein [Candidatus Collierbacteria bacterium]